MRSEILALDNEVQAYAWGSTTAIPEFLGRPNPSRTPQAELWIGAHPKASSRVAGPGAVRTLADLIRESPETTLGPEVAGRFGELPFLLKVIAAAEPLSVQCHPNLDQAGAGFAREEAAGVPRGARERNYRDPNHKPELIVAMGPFTALKGFRPVEEITEALRAFAAPELGEPLATLAREGVPALAPLFAALLSLDPSSRRTLLARAEKAAATRRTEPAWAWIPSLAAKYPGDVGALAPVLLNLVDLKAGEAMFLGPGEMHAYLEGTGLELMANSDNVLRGGLTPKHVDVKELLTIGRFEPTAPGVFTPTAISEHERVYKTPAPEFELSLVDVAEGAPFAPAPGRGVELLLGLEGTLEVTWGEKRLPLGRGQAAFVPASVMEYQIEGQGRAARAAVPRA